MKRCAPPLLVLLSALIVFLSMSTLRSNQPTLGFEDAPNNQPDKKIVPVGTQAAAPIASGTTLPRTDDASVFPEAIRPRGTVRFDVGDGVGYANGYTYLESFLPVYESLGRWLLFNNLRAVNYQNADLWEFNGGFGLRRFNPCSNRVLGIHAEYDGRTTLNSNYFNQITFGWESLGPRVDVRNNFYVPIGTRNVEVGQAATVFDPRFFQNNIIFSRNRFFEGTSRGADFEAGGLLAGADLWNLRGYLGYYHYDGSGLRDIDGVRGRLEMNVGNSLAFYFQAQNDAVNDTTVSGGMAFFFGPGKASRGVPGAAPYARMGERIVRDPNIMTRSQTRVVPEVALDAETGKPILVRHANSTAVPGGDGTFEHPYRTLGDLQAGSIPRDILFVHANSVFNNQSIVLQDRQRFLGEGLPYIFAAKQGTFLLPRATGGTLLPVIQTSSGDMVTLANRVEVAGFLLNDSGRDAIFGRSIGDVFVHDVAIARAARDGLRLVDVSGTNIFQTLSIAGAGRNGASIGLHEGVIGAYLLSGIQIADAARFGLALRTHDASQAYLSFANGSLIDSGRDGVRVKAQDASNAQLDLATTTIAGAARDGIHINVQGSSTLIANVQNNTLKDFGRDGVFLLQEDKSMASANIDANKINAAPDFPIVATLKNQSIGNYSITNNTISGPSIVGVDIHARDASQVNANIVNNAIDNGSFAGIHLQARQEAKIAAQITDNVLKGGANGVTLTLDDRSNSSFALARNQITDTSDAGIIVEAAGRSVFAATLVDNEILRSGAFGIGTFLANQSSATFVLSNNRIQDSAGIFFAVRDRSDLALVANNNTIRDNIGFGLAILQDDRSNVVAQIVGNKFLANRFGQVTIDMAGQATGDFVISGNTMERTFGKGVFVFLSNKADAKVSLTSNSISRSFGGGVDFDVADKTNLKAVIEDNSIFENFLGGVRFVQYDQSTVNARLARNQIFDNVVAHVAIDTNDKSFGAYQLAFNTLKGGFAAAVRATSNDKSKIDMQLFGNTVNRPIILFENDKSTFRLEKTIATNSVTFPGFFLIDPSIFPLTSPLGFPPP